MNTITIDVPEGMKLEKVSDTEYRLVPVPVPVPVVERPTEGYCIDTSGAIRRSGTYQPAVQRTAYRNFNMFGSATFAGAHSQRLKVLNAIACAAEIVDPHFKPDWMNSLEMKFFLCKDKLGWNYNIMYVSSAYVPVFSTVAKAREAIKLLEKWGV